MFSKKVIASFFFLFLIKGVIVESLSQEISGNIIYSVSTESLYKNFVKKDESNPNSFNLDIAKRVTKLATNFECRLDFNNQMSQFYLMDGMALDEDEQFLAIAKRIVVKGIYLTNLHTSTQILKDNSQDDSFIESPISVDWKLTTEFKKIGDFICYKATTYKELPSSKALVTVWYTPEIPFAYGPKEFVGNLPGLILEYNDNVVTFRAKEVSLNPKNEVKLEWPTSNKVITQEQYQSENKNSFNKLKESYSRD
jgi:GLPGLI family protein